MADGNFEPPKWAGKPPAGLHLDVVKDDKLIQKLMVDEKKYYLFGRNPTMNDFCIDHSSCSRVHAALVYHKFTEKNFLMDLNSTHGTYIGSKRIDPNVPTYLPPDTTFHFGASTRYYTLREKPQKIGGRTDGDGVSEESEMRLDLPEDQTELDSLTEYNTANNKRTSMLGIPDVNGPVKKSYKRKSSGVRFKEEEEVINPEDVDPTVGKFRNLVQTSIIPNKKTKRDESHDKNIHILRPDHESDSSHQQGLSSSYSNPLVSTSLCLKLGIHVPNPAPLVENDEDQDLFGASTSSSDLKPHDTHRSESSETGSFDKKKKYAKEAWPGRKPSMF